MPEPRPLYDERTLRRLDSVGGAVRPPGAGHAIIPGLVDGRPRDLGAYANDQLIQRDRTPVYDADSYHQAGALTDWTASGPIRRSLWMRQHTWRRQAGTDNTRALDPRPVVSYGSQDGTHGSPPHGMHSNPVRGQVLTFRTFSSPDRAQMVSGRFNRLSDSQYVGQSYSQTTQVQGG